MTFSGVTIHRIDPVRRRQSIGASDAAGVAGISPWEDDTPLMKWLDKLGRRPPKLANEAMTFGSMLEPVILNYYEYKTGLKVENRQLHRTHATIPFMTATLDGTCENRIVEAKNVGANSPGWDDEDGVPDHYMVQVQHQLCVFDAQYADLVVLRGGQKFQVYPIHRNQAMIDAIIRVEGTFWACVRTETPPDWGRVDAKSLALLNPECDGEIELDHALDDEVLAWELLRDQQKKCETQEKEIQARILEAMGTAKFAIFPSGRKVRRHLIDVAESVSVRQKHTRHYFQLAKKGQYLE